MSKQRLGMVLGLGLAAALLVSACGVALGPVQFTAGGPAILSPVVSGWQALAGTQPRATAHGMLHVQNFVAPEVQFTGDIFAAHLCHELH